MKNSNELENRKKEYKEYKDKAVENLKRMFPVGEDSELLSKLSSVAAKEGIIEICTTFGDGDNKIGYYHSMLILNVKNLIAGDYNNSIYLVEKYIPGPDQEYKWKVREFSKLKEFNFSNQLTLLFFLRRYTLDYWLRVELERLSERQFNTCVDLKSPIQFF